MNQRTTAVIVWLFIIAIHFLSGCVSVPDRLRTDYNHRKHGFQDEYDYGVRDSPITVREYLIFLSWNIDVYGSSYPEKVRGLFFGDDSDTTEIHDANFTKLFQNRIGGWKSYVLNPQYLDYPMTGLTENQLAELYRWLTDRYNENMLIEIGHINFNPEQRDEDTYSLEAYLCNYYIGDVNSVGRPRWNDNMYLSLFRPPYSNERPYIRGEFRKKNRNRTEWKAYEMNRSHFLWRWNELYLEETKEYLTLKIPHAITLVKSTAFTGPKYLRCSYYLEDRSIEFSDVKYIDDQEKRSKDQYGRMGYSIIARNFYGRPITKDSVSYNSSHNPKECIYWVVYNKEIEFEYWP